MRTKVGATTTSVVLEVASCCGDEGGEGQPSMSASPISTALGKPKGMPKTPFTDAYRRMVNKMSVKELRVALLREAQLRHKLAVAHGVLVQQSTRAVLNSEAAKVLREAP